MNLRERDVVKVGGTVEEAEELEVEAVGQNGRDGGLNEGAGEDSSDGRRVHELKKKSQEIEHRGLSLRNCG